MKKLMVYLCMGVLLLGLTACGSDKEEKDAGNENPAESTVQATQEPTTEPAQETEEAEESGEDEMTAGMDMSTLKQAVVDTLGEDYWPNTEIPSQYLESYGLTEDMYEEFFGEMPMISTNVDTLIVIQAKEDRVEEVEEVLNAYRDALINDTLQYPMNVGKIQASRIDTFGNYVCFIQLGADVTEALESGDEEVMKQCQEQNEEAALAIGRALGFN